MTSVQLTQNSASTCGIPIWEAASMRRGSAVLLGEALNGPGESSVVPPEPPWFVHTSEFALEDAAVSGPVARMPSRSVGAAWHPTAGVFPATAPQPPESNDSWYERNVRWVINDVPPPAHSAPRPAQSAVVYNPSVRSMLTDRVREVLDELLPIIDRQARRSHVPIIRIEITGYVDPEEDVQEVVVRQWVNVPVNDALEYWDQLGVSVDDWMRHLPDRLKRVAEEKIAIDVRWDAGDDSAT